jgi:hypothetical protein
MFVGRGRLRRGGLALVFGDGGLKCVPDHFPRSLILPFS